jgi:hypothetical protein
MLTTKDIFIDILTLIWWVGIWNTIDLLIAEYIEPEYHLRTNFIMGIIALILYMKYHK